MRRSLVDVMMAGVHFSMETIPMNYFLDTEFEENGETIMPISLALVREKGCELYIELEFDRARARANPFVRNYVLPYIGNQVPLSRVVAAKAIVEYIGDDPSPVFWAYYADYDWVLLCQLFGTMMDLPPHFPKFCLDLQQWYVQLGKPKDAKPEKPREEHNALADAYWNRAFFWNLERVAGS